MEIINKIAEQNIAIIKDYVTYKLPHLRRMYACLDEFTDDDIILCVCDYADMFTDKYANEVIKVVADDSFESKWSLSHIYEDAINGLIMGEWRSNR